MRHLLELLTISRENLRLRYKADIGPLRINHREIPCSGLFKLPHHAVHLLIDIHIRWSRLHEIIYMKGIIEFILEHVPSDVLKGHISLKMIPGINHREYISLRLRHLLDKVT